MRASDLLFLASVKELNLIALWILTGLCAVTWLALAFASRRPHLFALHGPTKKDVPWGLIDVWVVVLLWFLSFSFTSLVVDPQSGDRVQINLASGGAMFLATVAGIVWLSHRYGREATQWIRPRRIFREMGLGVVAFIAAVPPIFWLMGFLVQFFPYHHETLDQIKASPTTGVIWTSFFSAAVAAAIGEEFFFRLVLQGWLHRLRPSSSRIYRRICIYGNGAASGESTADDTKSELTGSTQSTHPIWAIAGSALVFAAMHFGQGPAPIALFVLGLALGYVFWISESWLVCVVLHAMMNSYSLVWETWDALEKAKSAAGS